MGDYNTRRKKNKIGRKLYSPSDDKQTKFKDGLWIKGRKRVFLYWFKFLQISIQEGLPVKWEKYSHWGNQGNFVNIKFDDWWKTHWKKCFGVKNRTDTPKYPLSHSRYKIEAIRMYYLICVEDLKGKYTNDEIAYRIVKSEWTNRFQNDNNLFYPMGNDGQPVPPDDKSNAEVTRRISVLKKGYKKLMKNVCNGTFP